MNTEKSYINWSKEAAIESNNVYQFISLFENKLVELLRQKKSSPESKYFLETRGTTRTLTIDQYLLLTLQDNVKEKERYGESLSETNLDSKNRFTITLNVYKHKQDFSDTSKSYVRAGWGDGATIKDAYKDLLNTILSNDFSK
ncbi:MAG: hypothetical protein WC916_06080 [Candidatus Woesearchaeota archaeon]